MSRKGLGGLLCKLFDDCVMFHLLTVFPNNAGKQEKYYFSNVLKKPQQVGVRQFVQRVEQLNTYIAQLPCWYHSPRYNPGMTPANEADLASHVLWMCLHAWQDQYNLHKKGINCMDMHSLLTSFKVIEHVCTQEKTHAQSSKNASTTNKTGTK